MSLPFNKIIIILTLSLGILACEKDESSEEECTNTEEGLRINFSTNWGGEAFDLFETYLNATEYNVILEQFKFYISDIILVKDNGEEVLLSDVELYDFLNNKTQKLFDIPAGSYQGIKFAWGVPVELNGTGDPDFDPTIYDVDHPLNTDNAMYWGWQPGYRFIVFDGRYDTSPDTGGDIPETFSIHTGTDTCYAPIEALDIPFNYQDGQLRTIDVNIDIEKAFYSSSDTIDLAVDNQSHGTNIQLALRLTRNIDLASTYTIE
ncbi:MAG: MbnP family protein [Bacteroidota bacterium]